VGGQVWKPKVDQQIIEEQKQAKEQSDRAWRTQHYFGSVAGGGGSTHGLEWSSMPRGMIWK
jgi:hypothetical protein